MTTSPKPKAARAPACRFLREAELAERWGLSPRTLQRWRLRACGPAFNKFGRAVSYPLEGDNGVLAWEAQRTYLSTSERVQTEGDL